ncbi:CopL family metal-binding regulatory protein [Arenimonas sp.]|uniref:CopL family metal-binding regulatory protein n=1 Tax=Arenimonas sp. TaxID=1872635 RepID=UPI0035B2FD76
MSVFRVLRYLVLVLALVAGGVAPGFAQEAQPMPETGMQSPCHGMDGELVDTAVEPAGHGDCCDGGECRCDCLQHSPAGVVMLRQLAQMPAAGQLVMPAAATRLPARTIPAIRPPIA